MQYAPRRIRARVGLVCSAVCGVVASAALLGTGPRPFMTPSDRQFPAWVEVPIVNPGFETTSRELAAFEMSNGAQGADHPVGTWFVDTFSLISLDDPVAVAGWRTFPVADPTILYYAGAMRPGLIAGGLAYLDGYSGDHVALSMVTPMQQTLRERVRPATQYRLTFQAGYGADQFASGVYVQMLAAPDRQTPVFQLGTPGVEFLGNTSISSSIQPPPAGVMETYTIEFVTPAVLPPELRGKFIVIALVGSDGLPSMCFDDFVLERRAVR